MQCNDLECINLDYENFIKFQFESIILAFVIRDIL